MDTEIALKEQELNALILEEKNRKELNKDSFPIDINLMEVPLFLYQIGVEKDLPTVKELLETTKSKDVKEVLINGVAKENVNSRVNIVSWTDSRGCDRTLLGLSMAKLPDGYCMSVYLALIKLFIEKNSPIKYDDETKKYIITNRELSFSIYEVCRIMNSPPNSYYYSKIRNAITRLRKVDYHSISGGVFYDKAKGKYTVNYQESIKLLDGMSEHRVAKEDNKRSDTWKVTIGAHIIGSIENNFIKFLNETTFFTIKGDLTRRLYLYIEGNRYGKNGKSHQFIKRSYDVLGKKIPLYFKYPSKFKDSIRNPLAQLKERGIISDYFFGDEVHINNKKDNSLYIIFSGTTGTIIDLIENKNIKEEEIVKEKKEYVFPTNLNKKLELWGVSEDIIIDISSKFDKYTIAKYYLYIKEKLDNGTAKNPAALFVFGIQLGKIDIKISAPEICEFVDNYKKEVDKKSKISYKHMDEAFEKYINKELKEFKENDIGGYEMISDSFVNPKPQAIANIETFTRVLNVTEDKNERKKIAEKILYWENVRDHGYQKGEMKEKIFNEYIAYAKLIGKTLLDKEAFRNKYINENK